MFLHDVGFDKFDIACEDTLTAPQHWDDEPFELIVSNPPYSIKWAGDEDATLINDPRFAPAGVLAPKSKADMAFILHSLSWLATSGTAAIVCFPGIMYRGGAEQKIRKYLVDNNFIDCVIQLPANLFFGTSIATCIMVLKKGKADNKTLFIDASGECVKVTNNNRLTAENIERIVSVYAGRDKPHPYSNWKQAANNFGHKNRTSSIGFPPHPTSLRSATFPPRGKVSRWNAVTDEGKLPYAQFSRKIKLFCERTRNIEVGTRKNALTTLDKG